ncbi:MAG: hypothetical protein IPP73_20035 [Chitinophagaceae bacterium]|nr:hypothetical protein [Chitinophagaceae bacterium]
MMAANNVYSIMLPIKHTTDDIHNVGDLVRDQTNNNTWENNQVLLKAVAKVSEQLQLLIYKLFLKRVHFFNSAGITSKYNMQPLIVYGGGFEVPHILTREILISDNGIKDKWVSPTFMEVVK